MSFTNYNSKVFHFVFVEMAFLWFEVKVVVLEFLQDMGDLSAMVVKISGCSD